MELDLIKLKIHSIVSEITNSSTVIYTYQNGCVEPAKELVNEMLKLSGITDKKAEDVFYFGVFCEDGNYFDFLSNMGSKKPEDFPVVSGNYGSDERTETLSIRQKWFDDLVLSIMKGDVGRPEWMEDAEEAHGWSEWAPESYLCLVPRDEKYTDFGNKIKRLLNGVTADGGRDG
jgi:hypothetical protein